MSIWTAKTRSMFASEKQSKGLDQDSNNQIIFLQTL